MKKTISICLFTVILAGCICGGLTLLDITGKKNENQMELAEAAEPYEAAEQTESTELAESMQVQKAYRYFVMEREGMLVVYEGDGRTLLFETNIKLHGLDEETCRLLRDGIFLADEEELYDFLESYSS